MLLAAELVKRSIEYSWTSDPTYHKNQPFFPTHLFLSNLLSGSSNGKGFLQQQKSLPYNQLYCFFSLISFIPFLPHSSLSPLLLIYNVICLFGKPERKKQQRKKGIENCDFNVAFRLADSHIHHQRRYSIQSDCKGCIMHDDNLCALLATYHHGDGTKHSNFTYLISSELALATTQHAVELRKTMQKWKRFISSCVLLYANISQPENTFQFHYAFMHHLLFSIYHQMKVQMIYSTFFNTKTCILAASYTN